MLIEFYEIHYKLLILLIFPVFSIIEDYAKKLYLTKNNFLFRTFLYFLSYNFSFIFLLIFLRKNKNKSIININQDDQASSNNSYKQPQNNITLSPTYIVEKHIKRKKIFNSFLFLLILCVISLSCFIYRRIFENMKYKVAKKSIGVLFDIIFFALLSKLILKQKLYKHNYISLSIISIVLLILFIISIASMDKDIIFFSIIYYLFYALLFALYDVLVKKYMTDFYNTPYFTMFIIGIIGSFSLIIFDLFAYFLNREISGIIIGFQDNVTSFLYFLAFMLHLIIEFIRVLGILLTIYYFTPCHFFISEYISEFITYMIDVRKLSDEFYIISNVIIFSIAFVINFFFTLVFNEVIILNFCNLDYNTKKRIEERMKKHDDNLMNILKLDINSDDNESSELQN